MHLVAAAVVRLVRTLAHELLSDAVSLGVSTPQAGLGAYDEQSGRRTLALRPAPPTHAREPVWVTESWTCGTRRHGVTGQRYARWRIRVKLRTVPQRARLWMTACRGVSPLVRLRLTEVPDTAWRGRWFSGRGRLVTRPLICRLTCTLMVRAAPAAHPGCDAGHHHGASGSQTVDNSVDEITEQPDAGEVGRWTTRQTISGPHGEPSSMTSSHTNAPGCAPASR